MSDPTTPAAWGIQLARLWLGAGQGFPVRVADIAIEVTKQRFEDPVGCVVSHGIAGIDGMLSKRKKGDWCISYDETVTVPGRINFTVGHELGHYLLHRKTRDRFQCGAAELMDYDSVESRRMEAQANVFSSYLLMPRNDFHEQVKGQKISFDLLGHCAERYQTSMTATALKWLEFTDEAAMLVVADHDDFICWSFCSAAARRLGSYKSPGTIVPQSALDYLRGHGAGQCVPRRVDAGVWHMSEEAEEFSIISDQFEQLIFLIRFPYASMADHGEEQIVDAFSILSGCAEGLNWSK